MPSWLNAATCAPTPTPFFFFNDTATTEIYTLSLHDALPISAGRMGHHVNGATDGVGPEQRSLRALEDLDAIDVEQIEVRADGAGEKYPVQIHAHARIQVECEIILSDAADGGREHRAVAGEG